MIAPMSIFGRTFHPDEANQAFTAGRLLETGVYRYNPQDHHGPTLYYAAATLQKAAGRDSTATLDPTLLRCTPLLFAVLAIVFGALATRKLAGRIWHGIIFALLLGTSPIFVFFATDFIQEMLLAAFTMMMFWSAVNYLYPRLSSTQTLKPATWALIFGIAAGLAFATKETAVLAFIAAGIAFMVSRLTFYVPIAIFKPDSPTLPPKPEIPNVKIHPSTSLHAILAFAGFFLTAFLLYSSFASNWQGVYNAFITAPLAYLHRATGDATSQGAAAHVHPWWQYLKWMFTFNWRFSMIPLLAAFAVTFRPRGFLHLYAIALLLLYSFIPYKTPWCALQIVLPLAAAPCAALPTCSGIRSRIVVALLATAVSLNAIGIFAMNRDPDAKDIPYNYASASPQVKALASLIIDKVAANPIPSTPDTKPPTSNHQPSATINPFAAIALPAEDTWPLPFYLRSIKDKVGYWTQFGELETLVRLGHKPSVVVVPAEEGHLVQSLFPHLKHTKRFEMRPRVRVRVFW